MTNCEELGLVPEPKTLEMLERLAKAERPEVDLSHHHVGDDVIRAISGPVCSLNPVAVKLRDCRLSAKGVAAACAALGAKCTRLEEIDFAVNDCRAPSAASALLNMLDAPAADGVIRLKLAACQLAAEQSMKLASGWARRAETGRALKRLVELDLAKNALNAAADALGAALGPDGAFPALRVLNVSSTGLQGAGAAAVAEGLGRSHVQRADLSWNAFRADQTPPREDDAVAALRLAFSAARKLWHVNLSYNHMTAGDLRRLEPGAKESRTLAGLRRPRADSYVAAGADTPRVGRRRGRAAAAATPWMLRATTSRLRRG